MCDEIVFIDALHGLLDFRFWQYAVAANTSLLACVVQKNKLTEKEHKRSIAFPSRKFAVKA